MFIQLTEYRNKKEICVNPQYIVNFFQNGDQITEIHLASQNEHADILEVTQSVKELKDLLNRVGITIHK